MWPFPTASGTVLNPVITFQIKEPAMQIDDATLAHAPWTGRPGHVGGIESIVLDGVTWWFGFDYSEDLVVSPLIDDIDAMARHASAQMLQRDGAHDVAYWRALADDGPQLCDDEAERSFTRAALATTMAQLQTAQANDTPMPDLVLAYHLRYLLCAAGDWVAGAGFEAANTNIALLRGEQSLPAGRRPADAARDLRAWLTELVSAAPGNWATLFALLKT
jgi:hypothetical protein